MADFKLPAGKYYKIEASKAGKVSFFFNIDLKQVTDELVQGGSVPSGALDYQMFEKVPNVDFSYVETNPATEMYFDPVYSGSTLAGDPAITNNTLKKIDKINKEIQAQQKLGEANYNSLIKQADALYAAKKYEEAKGFYEQALLIKQTEKHPNDRLMEIEGILNAQKSANLANAQLDEEYKNLITAADALKNQKKYEEAIARYKEALSKKPEQYPKDQIEALEEALENQQKAAENQAKYTEAMRIADVFYKQQSWDAAKGKYTEALKYKAGDPVATAKLKEIDGKMGEQKVQQEKKKQYDDAVAEGEALMGKEKWAEAKAKFTEALTYEASSTYVKSKIAEVDAKLAEIEKEKAKNEQIKKLIEEGNTALASKQTAVAKTKFEDVLKLDAENNTAKTKLAEIEKILADEKANAEKIAQAKQLVAEGDALAKSGKNAEAKSKYQDALALVPDPAVEAKIDALNDKLTEEAKKAETKARIEKLLGEGDVALNSSDFTTAKQKFEEVLTIDVANATAKQKLLEVQ